jgi:phage regulator Rha-like protein
MTSIIPIENIVNRVYFIRGRKVMLDSDLARLYGVRTKQLNRQVKRNKKRFPEDFMFRLTVKEANKMNVSRQQTAILKQKNNPLHQPYVFTEQGVAMLSSLLNGKKAAWINVLIVRAFIKIREMLASHRDMAIKIAQLETKYDEQFVIVFNALKHLMIEPEKKK